MCVCACVCLVLQIFTVALLGVLRLPPVLIGRKLWQSLAAFVHFHGTLGATTMDGDGNGGQTDKAIAVIVEEGEARFNL